MPPQQSWQLWRYICVQCKWHLRVVSEFQSGLYKLYEHGSTSDSCNEVLVKIDVRTTTLQMSRGRILKTTTLAGIRCGNCGEEWLELTGNRQYHQPAWYDVTNMSALRNHGIRVHPRRI